MRLICPNCGAQYEVPDDAIPAGGRDVQCSNCAHTWLEMPGGSTAIEDAPGDASPEETAAEDRRPADRKPPDHKADEPRPDEPRPDEPRADDRKSEAPAAVAGLVSGITLSKDSDARSTPTSDAAAAVSAKTPVRQPLSPTVAEILREEAAREEAARRADAGAVESQPDLDLDRPIDREEQLAEEARRRMARLKGEQAPTTSSPVTSTSGSRSELLPDIEEISSSLRSTSDRQSDSAAEAEPEVVEARKRRGFRFGFVLMVLIFAVLAMVYVLAPRIAEAVPQAAPALTRYVETVDDGRLWLDRQVQGLLAASEEAPTPTIPPTN